MSGKNVKKTAKNHGERELVYEDDGLYGKRMERPQSEINKRRPLRNFKKAWESHVDDWDAVDDFFETR